MQSSTSVMSTAPSFLKLEPSSPASNADEVLWGSGTDTELYWTTEELEAQLGKCDTKGEVLEKMLDMIEHLEDGIPDNEDAFSNYWMEGKLFPLFEDSLSGMKPCEEKPQIVSYDPTQNLLKEFENVFDAVNNGAFTPPQSPPYQHQVLTILEPVTGIYTISPSDRTYPAAVVPEQKCLPHVDFMPPTPQTDVAHELAVVDELVRSRVENLVPSSPSSSSSNFGDCSSDDPEWTMDSSCDSPKASLPKTSRKRSKPYSQYSDDKKSRKKEQNKNAATRYRMKKKAEVDEILGEEKGLLDHNTDLKTNITDLGREIKYLKGLMRDLFKAKGLIQ